jgi:short-subunit dehydrogenase
MYTASKHAVKGFNDTLRVEVEEVDEAPISITLIQPTATDTPFPQHARNFMDREAKLPEPMIEPRKVAEAILSAAEKPTRATQVGGGAKMNVAMSRLLPGMADKMAAKYVDRQQYEEPPRNPEGILFVPSEATGLVAQTHGTGGHEPG